VVIKVTNDGLAAGLLRRAAVLGGALLIYAWIRWRGIAV
jgi:hypothetical protein